MINGTELGASIVVSFPDGATGGIWQVDRNPDWNVRLFFCPRACYEASRKREELGWPGVYILRGQSEDEVEPTIYVGEGDPVRDRLDSHYANKGFWDEAFVCVAGEGKLNKAHIQHLESRLVALAREAKHCKLDNANTPNLPTLSKLEAGQAENHLGKLLSVLRVLGLTVFEKSEGLPVAGPTASLTLTARGIIGKGHMVSSGFVVHKGSQAVLHEVASASDGLRGQRKLLSERKKVLVPEGDHLVFSEDYAFKSPSGAASVLLGRSADGRKEWKDGLGKTLKELQAGSVEVAAGGGVFEFQKTYSPKPEKLAAHTTEAGPENEAAYNLDYHLNSTSPEMQKLTKELRGRVLQLPCVEEKVGQKSGITYKTTKSFTRLEFKKTWVQLLLRDPQYPEDTKKLVKDITNNGWGYLGMVKFKPDTDVDYLFGLVKASYHSTL
jgi:predicted transport protein